MMFVIESGVHSSRRRASQLLLRVMFPFRELPKVEAELLMKFSVERRMVASPSLWFQRMLPSSFSLSFFS